jgi:hypothetical protein
MEEPQELTEDYSQAFIVVKVTDVDSVKVDKFETPIYKIDIETETKKMIIMTVDKCDILPNTVCNLWVYGDVMILDKCIFNKYEFYTHDGY